MILTPGPYPLMLLSALRAVVTAWTPWSLEKLHVHPSLGQRF